jgi:hypothetical protein
MVDTGAHDIVIQRHRTAIALCKNQRVQMGFCPISKALSAQLLPIGNIVR